MNKKSLFLKFEKNSGIRIVGISPISQLEVIGKNSAKKPTLISYDGYQYRVLLTNSCGGYTVTSTQATLTVDNDTDGEIVRVGDRAPE